MELGIHGGEEPLYFAADEPIPVLVRDNGGGRPGRALGWSGELVHVTYSSGIGMNNIIGESAEQVQRVGHDEQLPPST